MPSQKVVSLLIAVLLVTALGALAASGEQERNDPPPVSQQIETLSFVNDTGMPVDGLVVTFDVKNVKTQSSDVFSKSITVGKTITLSQAVIAPCTFTNITFERDGAFQVVSYQWTANDASAGGNHQGPPGSNVHPGPPGGSPPPVTGNSPCASSGIAPAGGAGEGGGSGIR